MGLIESYLVYKRYEDQISFITEIDTFQLVYNRAKKEKEKKKKIDI